MKNKRRLMGCDNNKIVEVKVVPTVLCKKVDVRVTLGDGSVCIGT